MQRASLYTAAAVLLALSSRALHGDGIRDNDPAAVRPIPPPGIEVPAEARADLEGRLEELRALRSRAAAGASRRHLADADILSRAVEVALEHGELFSPKELDVARGLLDTARERLAHIEEAPWLARTGLVVLGYTSRIDGSVQPYGLVVPPSYRPGGGRRHRLDIWFHGRGEKLSELNFIHQRMTRRGQYTPPDTFVLHPYGRYCNAFKLAGEVDVLEALADVRARYPIDEDRISVRGFSMGGAGCWQFAVHYADRWFAANPGAGFAETPEFLRIFQKEELHPAPWERTLWHLYDCTDYALNLYHCPTVAYSGELDVQKQAADIMARALETEGIELVHIIGPGVHHRIHPDSKIEIERRMASLAARGRERVPRTVHLVTYTLKYNRMHWVTVDALGEHWRRARVDAEIEGADTVRARTENVAELTLSMPAGWCPLEITRNPRLEIDGQLLPAPRPGSDRSWVCRAHRAGGRWRLGPAPAGGLRKRHDLQGPIDDAFMDSFIIVRPTGAPAHELAGTWAASELDHAITSWRRHFRGDARVKDDTAVTAADVESSSLVLFGDPSSNAVIRRVIAGLPVSWDAERITVGSSSFDASTHALILVYPDPLDAAAPRPGHYIVFNSGFTFREYAHLNNARQVPKLPDWAVVDLRTPPGSRWPGKVAAAGFFDERWQVR